MSVLTVSGSAAIPDRTLPIDYTRTQSFATRSQLPSRVEPVLTSRYTRPAAAASQPAVANSHRHSRTVSSALLPTEPIIARYSPSQAGQPQFSPRFSNPSHSRQSSTSTMETMHMQRQPTTGSATSAVPRRSTSSRSTGTNSPTSYVALMRKQKATVWCDRSQHTDQRLAAAQRAAKQRANLEVHGAIATSARTSTASSGGVVGKIRHGGVPKAPGYSPANMSGAGVPLRLSANEMLGDDETDARSDNAMVHGRSGSGKSSASSTKYRSGYPKQASVGEQNKYSQGQTITPPNGSDGVSPGREGIPELDEPDHPQPYQHYGRNRPDPVHHRSESEDSFGDVKELSGPSALQQATQKASNAEDLRRRGSVDERAMSMGAGVRLFVANPDLDD